MVRERCFAPNKFRFPAVRWNIRCGGGKQNVKTLAGITILLSIIGLFTAVRGREHETLLGALTALFLLLLSLCGGALAFLFLVWY